ncbi:TRAP transporter substrate-binding protein [Azospirillum rugosum]|uniref:Tripartite ATP-independent transporter DctP family solute receptor n=1 Tax=Azospirillum rugosum TaxID=416170 RepID=A0ABS4SGU8_9PROT|nr:TRAP transporter substrate-binding protein [Azospirillum rugosum]MBP2291791.1 tripartite ATP-independent transporter DctP family solute receptor [Azospirillum rugosum]MDQ0524397.1 tripartite ATP-independent transporter DctP family solute receptor [Azospirillum rugosum]
MLLKRVIATGVFALGLATSVAAGAEELKLGYSLAPTSHYGVGATAMGDELSRLSGGKWTIKQFPANALGGEREMVEGAQIGTVDIVVTSSGPVGNFVPDTLITDIPFLFKDYAHAHAVLDGPIGQAILDQFPKHGLIALAWGENGFRNLTNSKHPVKSPADAKGLKIRTMENQVHMTAFKALGVLPTPMAFPELFTAMQQGTVDGQENPIGVILSAKFSQVQKYLTVTQHVYSPALIILSPSVWNKLSDQEKGWFKQAALAGAKAMRQKAEDDAKNGIEELKKQGMEVVTDVDTTAFQEALKPAYADYAKKFGQDKIDAIKSYKY